MLPFPLSAQSATRARGATEALHAAPHRIGPSPAPPRMRSSTWAHDDDDRATRSRSQRMHRDSDGEGLTGAITALLAAAHTHADLGLATGALALATAATWLVASPTSPAFVAAAPATFAALAHAIATIAAVAVAWAGFSDRAVPLATLLTDDEAVDDDENARAKAIGTLFGSVAKSRSRRSSLAPPSDPLLPVSQPKAASTMTEGIMSSVCHGRWTNLFLRGTIQAASLIALISALASADISAFAFGRIGYTGIQLLSGTHSAMAACAFALLAQFGSLSAPARSILLVLISMCLGRVDSILARSNPKTYAVVIIHSTAATLAMGAAHWVSEPAWLVVEDLSSRPIVTCFFALAWAAASASTSSTSSLAAGGASAVLEHARLPFRCIAHLGADLALLATVAWAAATAHTGALRGIQSPWLMLYATMVIQVGVYIRWVIWPVSPPFSALWHIPPTPTDDSARKMKWSRGLLAATALYGGACVFWSQFANPVSETVRLVLVPTEAGDKAMVRYRHTEWQGRISSADVRAPSTSSPPTPLSELVVGMIAPSVLAVAEALGTASLWTRSSSFVNDSSTANETTAHWHLYVPDNATLTAATISGRAARLPGLAHVAIAHRGAVDALAIMAAESPAGRWFAVGAPDVAWNVRGVLAMAAGADPTQPIAWTAAGEPDAESESGPVLKAAIVSRGMVNAMGTACGGDRNATMSLDACLKLVPVSFKGTPPSRRQLEMGARHGSVAMTPATAAPRARFAAAVTAALQLAPAEYARSWTWQVPWVDNEDPVLTLVHGVEASLSLGNSVVRYALASGSDDQAIIYERVRARSEDAWADALAPRRIEVVCARQASCGN